MGILWLIIKIILFILLGLIGIILLALGIILLAPIRYEAYLEKYNELEYDVKVRYLKWINAHFCMEKDKVNHEVKAFGKVLYENKQKEEWVTAQEHEKVKKETKPLQEEGHKGEEISQTPKMQQVQLQKNKDKLKEVKTEQVKTKEVDTPIVEEAQDGIEETTKEIKKETKETLKKIDLAQFKALFLSPLFWEALKVTMHTLKRIFKYIRPKEWSFEVIVGKSDPAETGELLAKLSLLYPWYREHGIVRGDFENERLEGGFLVTGRFCILNIIGCIIGLLLHKKTRQYIKLIRKVRKEEKHGK